MASQPRPAAAVSWRRIHAVVRKDLRAVLTTPLVLVPLLVLPLILCVGMPVLILVLATHVDQRYASGMELLHELIRFYPVPAQLTDELARALYVFLNYTFLPLFLLVPLMASSVLAASAIVGEKERRTLETLLATPITNRELFVAKVLGTLLPAVGVGVLTFALYFGAANLAAYATLGVAIVRAPIWLPVIALLMPAVALLGLTLMLLASARAKTFNEAQQLVVIVVLPLVALVVGQISGVVVFNPLVVTMVALGLGGGGFLLLRAAAPRFTREALIATL